MKSIIYFKTKAKLHLSGLAVMVCFMWPSFVYAHAILIKSQPEKDATLTEAPKRVDLWFNDKVGSEHKALAVIGSDGTRVDNKDVDQEMFDKSHLFATVQPLAPGTYTVRYRVVSIDTHIVTGKYQFSVKAP